jgi:hypothetical protein
MPRYLDGTKEGATFIDELEFLQIFILERMMKSSSWTTITHANSAKHCNKIRQTRPEPLLMGATGVG